MILVSCNHISDNDKVMIRGQRKSRFSQFTDNHQGKNSHSSFYTENISNYRSGKQKCHIPPALCNLILATSYRLCSTCSRFHFVEFSLRSNLIYWQQHSKNVETKYLRIIPFNFKMLVYFNNRET